MKLLWKSCFQFVLIFVIALTFSAQTLLLYAQGGSVAPNQMKESLASDSQFLRTLCQLHSVRFSTSDSDSSLNARQNDIPSDIARASREALLVDAIRQGEISISPGGSHLTLTINFIDSSSIKDSASAQKQEEAGQAAFPGYGDDLKIAIQKAVSDLRRKDFQTFISKMYPRSELLAMQKGKRKEATVNLLKQNESLAAKLQQQLENLQELKPKLVKQGAVTLAFFVVKRDPNIVDLKIASRTSRSRMPPEPDQSIVFEMTKGNWRFYDGNQSVRKVMGQQFKKKTGTPIQIELQKSDSSWRINKITLGES